MMKACRLSKKSRSQLIILPSNFDRLTDDLVVEILHRLPLKRVHRCKCVSKRWLNLISSPSFTISYAEHKKEAPFFGLFYQNCRYYEIIRNVPDYITLAYAKKILFGKSPGFSLEFLSSSMPIHVLSSNSGLILCSDAFLFQNKYYICNPLTKNWVTIPPPPSAGLKWARIGFLCKSTDFVIVRVAGYGEEEKPTIVKLEVYSSLTGRWAESDLDKSWKQSEKLMIDRYSHFTYNCSGPNASSGLNAVVCKGLLHWRGCGCVFVYNYNNGQYRVLQLLDRRHNKVHDRYLGVSKGNLMYIYFEFNLTFVVWELRDYDSNNGEGEWGLLHKICLDQMVFGHPAVRNLFNGVQILMSFLAFHPFDKDVMFLCLPPNVYSCNMQKKTIKHVGCMDGYFVRYSMPYLVVLPWSPLHVSHYPPAMLIT